MAVRRPAVSAGVVLALAVTLSACASDPPATTAPPSATAPASTLSASAPPTTTSAPPTTTQAPVDPVVAKIPKAARANTQEGAEAFTKFFYEQVAASWMKPDPELLDGLYSKSCKTCLAYRDTAAYLHEQEQRYESSPLTLKSVSAMSFQPKKVEIAAHVIAEAASIVDRSGKTVESVPSEGKQTFVLTLRFDGRWTAVLSQVEVLR
jgi:hypothetical protein